MVGTLTPIGAGLRLTVPIPSPLRDDFIGIKVWLHTATLGAGNPSDVYLKWQGDAYTLEMDSLPISLHYVKWAYLSEIDPTDYDADATELSATPLPIDGTFMASVLRGKIITDKGATVATAVVKPNFPVTVTTIPLNDATDFSSSGGSLVIITDRFDTTFNARYTSKSSNTLTGVSGLQNGLSVGDLVIPIPYASGRSALGWTSGSGPLDVQTGPFLWGTYAFPAAGGNGLRISDLTAADAFTYTSGHRKEAGGYTYYPTLDGISGLATFTADSYILHNPGFSTAGITLGTVKTLTLNVANTSLYAAAGGSVLLASTAVAGIFRVGYDSVVGNVMTLSADFDCTASGTYFVIPDYNYVVIGSKSSLVGVSMYGVHMFNDYLMATISGNFSGYVSADAGFITGTNITVGGAGTISGTLGVTGSITTASLTSSTQVDSYDGTVRARLNTASGTSGWVGNHTDHDFGIRTNNGTRMWIEASTQNFGVGNVAPTTKFHVTGPIRTNVLTVATLAAAGTVGAGTRAFVSNATATTFASIVAGGGANGVPVYSDGTNWRIG